MRRGIFVGMLCAVTLSLPAPLRAQAGARVDTNPQLFAVMCALHAAGYESNVSLEGALPIRARLLADLLAQQGPATEALREFYRRHALSDAGATLSRYISFALVAGPPPNFVLQLSHDELPPDVLAIEGFADVLVPFYLEAKIEEKWKRAQPDYEAQIRRLHAPVSQIVFTASGYLRVILNARSPRTFSIFVEPLVGTRTNYRNYADHAALVLNPAADLQLDEIRHAYLHFLLDPHILRHRQLVAGRQALLNYAARAPRLSPAYRDDFSELFAECLVKGVELRLRRLRDDALEAAVVEQERDGFVLVRPIVRELLVYEKAEPAMSFYFPDLVRRIDVGEESRRLEKMEFAAANLPAPAAPEGPARAVPAELREQERWLIDGERQIAAQNAAEAVRTFSRVLEKSPGQPRAVYGLAVATVLQGDPDRAKELFLSLLQAAARSASPAAPDSRILAWTHVYLGRIYDVEGNRELAVSEYRAALAVEGAPEAPRAAARRGIEKGYEPAAANQKPGA